MRFLDALREAEKLDKNIVIPDIKCFSPKEGELMGDRDPVDYARELVAAGAPVLSVVTEEKDFHGSMEMLKAITAAVDVPVLRKDFIHTREDLLATKEAGASAILLMCSCLEQEELFMLYEAALEIGLDPFVETHRAEDFSLINKLGAKLVGINNRDILVLERDDGDVSHTLELSSFAPKDAFLITESSIVNPGQVRQAIKAGANAALVGTAILQAKNTRVFYKMMCSKICMKVCGLMNENDIDLCINKGVERLGLVTEYPVPVPWTLKRERAYELRKQIPRGYQAVMVAGGSLEEIVELTRYVIPDMVQVHYSLDSRDMEALVNELHKLGAGVITTMPASSDEQIEQFGSNDIEVIVRAIYDTGIDEILVDPRNKNNAAQKNLQADMDLFQRVKSLSPIPVILAGGINPDNLGDKLSESGAESVDIMNGSENAPGEKSAEKIDRLLEVILR